VGDGKVVVDIPARAVRVDGDELATVSGGLSADAGELQLAAEADGLDGFPQEGAWIQVGREIARYQTRVGDRLDGLERGAWGTSASDHEAGARVVVADVDVFLRRIEVHGELQFRIVVESSGRVGRRAFKEEQTLLREWIAAHPEVVDLAPFHELAAEAGGPTPGLRWYPERSADPSAGLAERSFLATLTPENPGWVFTGEDLGRVFATADHVGYPAIGFEMTADRRSDFGDFTGSLTRTRERLALVFDGEILTAPEVMDRLDGPSQITGGAGGFSEDEVTVMVSVLRSGPTRVPLELESIERTF
jgi:hypothetical protein